MLDLRNVFASGLFIVALFGGTGGNLDAHGQSNQGGRELKFYEDFNGSDPDTMLGGAIDFANNDTNWFLSVVNGQLRMENRSHPRSVVYNDISWVRYPGAVSLSSTKSSKIKVDIAAQNKGRGGAGILFGSGVRGHYWLFAIDGAGRYFLIKKVGRKSRMVFSEVSSKIHSGRPNELSYELQNKSISFIANGNELVKIPLDKSDQKLTGIGLGAFGIGVYSFDNVEISEID